ncbi:MAG: PQQ-dependent sugar dehydrogenase, partial [Luteolibacter sp.]
KSASMLAMKRFLWLFAGLHLSVNAAKVENLYESHCASCHGAKLEGGQGGSLIDGDWKHGASDADIYRSIAKGIPEMGMTPWDGVLSAEEIRSLVILIREKEKESRVSGIKFPVPSQDQVTSTKLHDYQIETLIENDIERPWAIAFLSDGRMLLTERPGRLRIISADGKLDPEPVAGLPEIIEHGQGGLMEVATHPDHANNGWIYLGISDGERKPQTRVITAVVRGRIQNNRWTDQEWIYRPDPSLRSNAGVHFGTRFVFQDGYIFFVIGERGGMMKSQDLSNPTGKIFRLHDDGRIPKDNPFVDDPNAIPGIWSYGHRNPQGLVIDPRDGSIYSTEHGPRGGDELNRILPGRNYGWPIVTYGMNYNGTPMVAITEKDGITQPIVHWTPSIAVCGLDIVRGSKFPRWKHDLLAGALAQQEIRRIRIQGHKVIDQEVILKDIGRVRDVACGPDGLIYVVLNGPDRLLRLRPAE